MENNQNLQPENKVGLKVFLLIVIQIIVAIPLYLLVFITVNAVTNGALLNLPVLQAIIATILFIASLYIALLIRSNKFVFEDIKPVSQMNAMVNAVFGLLGLLAGHDFTKFYIFIAYTIFGYLVPKWFLENKFKKSTTASIVTK